MARTNFLYGNSTNCDLRPFHAEIVKALTASGQLPEDLAGLFEAKLVPVEHGNPDGTPRYMIVPR